jgi:DNA-binding XRE family transcriptional regulator
VCAFNVHVYENGKKITEDWLHRKHYSEWPLDDMALFGSRIRLARNRAGLSQRRLAELAEVSQTSISRVERGIALGFTLMRLVAIAKVLGSDFPFGQCPHDHQCPWPQDPRTQRRTFWDILNSR